MKRMIGFTALLLALSAGGAAAQRPASGQGAPAVESPRQVLERSGIVAALDSVAAASRPELQQALDRLALTLSGLVTRIADDPELRTSALRAAQGMVGVAQVVVEENSEVIQEALRTAADRIAELPIPQDSAARRR